MSVQNIIVINDFAHINGGASQVALNTAIGLAQEGFQVTVFCAVAPVMPELLGQPGLEVICTNQHEIREDPNRIRAFGQGIWNYKARNSMEKLLYKLTPADTIIHVHSWTKSLSSSPVHIAIRRGFRVVLTLHDYFISCPNGGWYDYQMQQICTRHPLSISCVASNCDVRNYSHKLWRVARQIVQTKIADIPSGTARYIAVSEFSLEIIRKYLPDAPIVLIHNPINAIRESPATVHKNAKFVFVGRLSKEKGVFLFAEAVRKARAKGIVVGDGPEADTLIKQFPNMEFTGWISSVSVKSIVRKARALVFPSLLYETQGLAVLEAMSLGVPVIVADTVAACDFIRDTRNGLWFQGNNVGSLSEKISQLNTNSDFAKKLGITAYKDYWSNPFSLDNYIQKLIQIYDEVVSHDR